MGTKNDPGDYDCHAKALPDEPKFTLLARDPDFHRLVMKWARRRSQDVQCGLRPASDMEMVAEARSCAFAGREWRKNNNGKWRAE
jgi:hypothetical protein